MKTIESEEALMEEILRSALWEALYHEQELQKAQVRLGALRALLKLAGMEPTDEEIEAAGDWEEGAIATASETAAALLGSAISRVHYHEEPLPRLWRKVSFAKALAARAGIEIDARALEAKVFARLRED
jgi:hypothetical protein